MKRASLIFIAAPTVLALAVAACGGGSTSTSTPAGPVPSTSAGTGKAVFAVKDAAADMGSVTKVNVTVNSMRVHAQGGAWTDVATKTQTFDLLALRAKGTAQLIAEASLAARSYDQVEIGISKVVVTSAKGDQEAKLPSNKLQIKGDVQVQATGTATATFDFIADRSLHVTGEGQFIMAPVIKVETRSNATAQIKSNNEVAISGGSTRTNSEVGTDVEGNVDVGLRITPDAVLAIAGSGKVVQVKGQALVVGTVKAVDTANGTVTIASKSGGDLVLQLAGDSSIKLKGGAATLANLSSNIGAEVAGQYNSETKVFSSLNVASNAGAGTSADANANLQVKGTVKSVDSAAGTITIAADSGADVVLKVAGDSKVLLGDTTAGLAGITAKVGSRIDADYNASSSTATQVKVATDTVVSGTGTLKAVDTAKGTVTLATQGGADLVLNVSSGTTLTVNGSSTTLAGLKSMIGSDVNLGYSQSSRTVINLAARGAAQQATVNGTIRGVNPIANQVTIATDAGSTLVLDAGTSTKVTVNGAATNLVDLTTRIGSRVIAEYNAQTNAAASISAQGAVRGTATPPAPAPTAVPTASTASGTATVNGTITAVNPATTQVTIQTDAGATLVLNVVTSARMTFNGAASTMAELATKIGSRVTAEYNTQSNAAASISAQGQASALTTVNGTIKSVNTLGNTVTLAVQGRGDVTLNLNTSSQIKVNGASSTAAALVTKVGASATAEYNVQANTVTTLSVQ